MMEKFIGTDISTPSQFYEILDRLCQEIDNGKFEQFILQSDTLCTKTDIHLFLRGRCLPDIIRYYFRDLRNGTKYLLEVETYHGGGGHFIKVTC